MIENTNRFESKHSNLSGGDRGIVDLQHIDQIFLGRFVLVDADDDVLARVDASLVFRTDHTLKNHSKR